MVKGGPQSRWLKEQRQAAILQAEGVKQAKITVAEGEAQAIKLVNEAADQYFKGMPNYFANCRRWNNLLPTMPK